MTNAITLGVFLGFWPLWLGWEIFLLVRRGSDRSVKTISMVARDRGWQLNSVAYLWAGLAAHFWWTGASHGLWGTVTFWGVLLLVILYDVAFYILAHLKTPITIDRGWERNPLYWAAAGIFFGHFFFGQTG